MLKILNKTDFNCVGDVAKHCDLPKLCIAEDEAIIFDLGGLFCDFLNEIKSIWKEVDEYDADNELLIPENYEVKKSLIYGGNFVGCNNSTSTHLGVKRTLIYYAYSRYLLINGFNDTPNGSVTKQNEFSIPKPLKEVESFSDKYRNMGYESYKQTLNFLCHNRDVFVDFNHKDCVKCGCGCESCSGRTKAKGFGLKTSIVRR